MTQVVIYKNKQGFIGFKVAGHTDFAEEGHDIVCAAVSSAAMLVINGICEVLGQDADIDIDEQRPPTSNLCKKLMTLSRHCLLKVFMFILTIYVNSIKKILNYVFWRCRL